MGHAPNILRNLRKLAELIAQLRAESSAGWLRNKDGSLTPVNTVSGCLARGAVIRGRCTEAEGCYRRVELDLAHFQRHGFGHEDAWTLQGQFNCGRLGGCKLKFDPPRYLGGTPLMELAQPPDSLLQFRCVGCGGEGYRRIASHLWVELRTRGREDADRVGVHTLAKRMRRVCAQCGCREWKGSVAALPTGSGALASGEEPEGDAAEPPVERRGMWKRAAW